MSDCHFPRSFFSSFPVAGSVDTFVRDANNEDDPSYPYTDSDFVGSLFIPMTPRQMSIMQQRVKRWRFKLGVDGVEIINRETRGDGAEGTYREQIINDLSDQVTDDLRDQIPDERSNVLSIGGHDGVSYGLMSAFLEYVRGLGWVYASLRYTSLRDVGSYLYLPDSTSLDRFTEGHPGEIAYYRLDIVVHFDMLNSPVGRPPDSEDYYFIASTDKRDSDGYFGNGPSAEFAESVHVKFCGYEFSGSIWVDCYGEDTPAFISITMEAVEYWTFCGKYDKDLGFPTGVI